MFDIFCFLFVIHKCDLNALFTLFSLQIGPFHLCSTFFQGMITPTDHPVSTFIYLKGCHRSFLYFAFYWFSHILLRLICYHFHCHHSIAYITILKQFLQLPLGKSQDFLILEYAALEGACCNTVGNKTIQMFGSFGLWIEYIFWLNG